VFLNTTQIGIGEVIAAVGLFIIGMLIALLAMYLRHAKRSERQLEEELRRRDEQWRQFWLSLYGQADQVAPPPSPAPAQQQLPYYEEGEEGRGRRAQQPQQQLTPYPYAADGYFRVLSCPICERDYEAKRPLFIVGKDADGTYILSCGHVDQQGRLHMLRLVDVRKYYAPIIEVSEVKETVEASLPQEEAPQKKKKKRDEEGEE